VTGASTASAVTEEIPVTDPATGQEIGRIPAGSAGAADRAVAAAHGAFARWRDTPAAERAALLKDGARRLAGRAGELAALQTAENGKPIADSRGGVEAGIAAIEQYAELGPLHRGRALRGSPAAFDAMVPEPFGVAACLTPWNDPVAIACQAVAACLVAGNTVVLKPSERTPLTASRVVELLDLPPGVLQLLHGDGRAGRPLVADPRVSLVYHVGAVAAGREIAEVCASQLKKAVLELGGNDPLIVDGDVDPSFAADQAATGAFANAGQICTSVERIYVHQRVAEPFLAALAARARSLVMGPGDDPATELGPLIDERHRRSVHGQVSDAVAAGAHCLCGGAVPAGPGSFYPATVLAGCTPDMAVMREETFGPVAPVTVVSSFEGALAAAAATTYGLAATVLTASPAHAQRAVRELDAGTVKVNAVFGGAPGGSAHPRRGSGLGYGYGPELLDEVSRAKVVHLAQHPPT